MTSSSLTYQHLAPRRHYLVPPLCCLHLVPTGLVWMCSPWEPTGRRALWYQTVLPLRRRLLEEDGKTRYISYFHSTETTACVYFSGAVLRKGVKDWRTDQFISERDRYLELKLVAVWWERCVHQPPPRERPETRGFQIIPGLNYKKKNKQQNFFTFLAH